MSALTPAKAIQTLLDGGWSEVKIALEVGTSQPTINRIKKGRPTSFEVGAKLVELASRAPLNAGSSEGGPARAGAH